MGQRSVVIQCSIPLVSSGLQKTFDDHAWRIVDQPNGDDVDLRVIAVRTSVGLGEIRTVRSLSMPEPILALASDDLELMLETLTAGATGVLTVDCTEDALITAAGAATIGLASMPIEVSRRLVGRSSEPRIVSDEEVTWLRHLATGMKIADLAPLLGYSERSLYRQLHALYERIGVDNRAGALLEARNRGLI